MAAVARSRPHANEGSSKGSRALIVHPHYHHTLPLEPLTLSFWDECCDAVLTRIAAGTGDARSLVRLMLVNQRCRRIAENDQLWRQLCMTRFNTPPHLHADGRMTWREVYRFNQEAFQWLVAQTAAEALMKLQGQRLPTSYVFAAQPMA